MMTQFDALMAQGYYNTFYNGGLGDIAATAAPFYDARVLAQRPAPSSSRATAPPRPFSTPSTSASSPSR